MLLSKCATCDSKNQVLSKCKKLLLGSLGIRTPLSKILSVVPLLFQLYYEFNARYKVNEIVNKFLLEGDKFMLEMHLRQVGFSYSACGPFTKNKERTKKFKEKGDS